jgi:hypothetical protein
MVGAGRHSLMQSVNPKTSILMLNVMILAGLIVSRIRAGDEGLVSRAPGRNWHRRELENGFCPWFSRILSGDRGLLLAFEHRGYRALLVDVERISCGEHQGYPSVSPRACS